METCKAQIIGINYGKREVYSKMPGVREYRSTGIISYDVVYHLFGGEHRTITLPTMLCIGVTRSELPILGNLVERDGHAVFVANTQEETMPVVPIAICPECGTVGVYVDRLRVLKCEECSYCAHNSMTDGKCNDCGMTDDDIWDEAEHQ